MTDILLTHTPDGGDIELANGRIVTDDTLRTAFYLSLFGGNEEDNGDSETQDEEFWGNKIAPSDDQKLRSKTQAVLLGTESTSANRIKVEDAVLEDLQWAVSQGWVESIVATVTIPSSKQARLRVVPVVNGASLPEIVFDSSWGT